MGEHKLNGEKPPAGDSPAASSGLAEAIDLHARAMLKAAVMPNGQIGIDPAQLHCDSQLHAVRLEVLFEALVKAGVIDPAAITVRLRDKLLAEVRQVEEEQQTPQILTATGMVPRRG